MLNRGDHEVKLEAYQSYVVSLENSKRMWSFARHYNLSRSFKVFRAVNALSVDFDPNMYPELRGLPPVDGQQGHCGCTLSHLYLWKELIRQTASMYLILEDDAIFSPYAEHMIQEISRSIPSDADIVFVNNRSAEKIFLCAKHVDGELKGIPGKVLFSRGEVLDIMKEHRSKLRRNAKGVPYFYSGTDGYILTRSGVSKLVAHINQYGFAMRQAGAGYNIDHFLTAITTKISDHRPFPMAYDVKNYIDYGVIQDKPLLSGYVAAHPMVEIAQRLGLGLASEIKARSRSSPEK
jgi:GR25 family glycosyltransferase involved in LPS biosynthesis